MAVIAVWKCDRDGAMFDNKKDADEHDKMLELAANITFLIEKNLDIDEKQSEAIGILLARHRDKLAIACKGKPDVLLDDLDDTPDNKSTAAESTAEPIAKPTETKLKDTSQTDAKAPTDTKDSPITTLAANQ